MRELIVHSKHLTHDGEITLITARDAKNTLEIKHDEEKTKYDDDKAKYYNNF